MTRRRRRLFGPLFYSTLVVAFLATAYTGVVTIGGDLVRRAEERQQMNSIVAMIRDTNPDTREAGAKILITKGREIALPYLLDAARDPHGEARALACKSLVQEYVDPGVVVPVLTAAADDDREEVRVEVARDLGLVHAYARVVVGSDSLPTNLTASISTTLIRLLKDRTSDVRSAAAEALKAFVPDPTAAAALLTATRDVDSSVRYVAASALLKFEGSSHSAAIQALLTMLADRSPVPDRRAILDVLNKVGGAAQYQAVTTLVDLLSHCESTERADVIDCIQSFGPQALPALPVLEVLLNDDDPLIRYNVGLAVMAILGKQHPRCVPILVGIIIDDELSRDWRMNTLETLRAIGPGALTKATPGLIRQLGDPDPTVRLTALSLLQEILGSIPAEMPNPGEGK